MTGLKGCGLSRFTFLTPPEMRKGKKLSKKTNTPASCVSSLYSWEIWSVEVLIFTVEDINRMYGYVSKKNTHLISFAPCSFHDYEYVYALNKRLICWGVPRICNCSCTGPDWTRPAPPGSRCVFYTWNQQNIQKLKSSLIVSEVEIDAQ